MTVPDARLELRPCPFCGGEEITIYGGPSPGHHASCRSCGLEAPTETGVSEADAIEYWNRRSPPVPVSTREEVAKIIYEAFPYVGAGTKPKWIPGGNSFRQGEALRAVDAILALSPVPVSNEVREALEETRTALLALKTAVEASNKMNGREYVDLGIQVNNALGKSHDVLSSHPIVAGDGGMIQSTTEVAEAPERSPEITRRRDV